MLLIWVIVACRISAIRNFRRQFSKTSDPPEPNSHPQYGGIIFRNVCRNIILHGVLKQNVVSTTPTAKA
jgi:hypothetical protein